MQPFNYSINVPNPQDSFMKGLSQSFALQDRAAAEQAGMAQQQQQMQMQQELGALSQKENPTAKDYMSVATKYPQLSAQLKQIWEPLDAEQKQNKISSAIQVMSAIKSGNIDIAAQLMGQQAEAARNSGKEAEANAIEALAKSVEINPKPVLDSLALTLSGAMGDKFASVYDSLTKAPLEAEKLALESGNLPTKHRLENQLSYEDVETKRLKRQLDVLDAQIKTADSELKRDDLQFQRDKLAQELGTKQTDKQETQQLEAQDRLNTIDTALGTIEAIKKSPLLSDAFMDRAKNFFTGIGTVYGKVSELVPGTDRKDFEEIIAPLKNQQFMIQMKALRNAKGSTGLGAMTEKEGERLEKAIASLNPDQSPAAFRTALSTIEKSMKRAQANVVGQGKLPTDSTAGGGTFVMQHPKYGAITDSTINQLLSQKPGMTRDQAIKFFTATGGK